MEEPITQDHILWYILPFIWNAQMRQMLRDREWISGCLGLREIDSWGLEKCDCSRRQHFFLEWWKCSKSDCGNDCTTLGKSLSHVQFFVTPRTIQSIPWNSPGQNTGVGSLSLLQGIFPTQGLNPGLLHCRRILYQLNHEGSSPIHSRTIKKSSSRPR